MKQFFAVLFSLFTVIFNFIGAGSFSEIKNKGDISGYADSVTYEYNIPDFNTDENGDFTVLQFTDTHFTTGLTWNDVSEMTTMENMITEYNPGLVIITGDMIDDGNSGLFNKSYVLRTVAEMCEEHGQYWAYAPGNNDGQSHGTTNDVAAYLSQYEHCIVYDDEYVSGASQYSIDIYNNDKLVHSVIVLDTMDYDSEDEDHIYGYVHEDQVEWCRREINSKIAVNPDVGVSVFMHENTPAFAKAAENGTAYKDGYNTISKSAEKYNIPKNQPLDDVFDASGCVGLVSIGHVHPLTNQCSFYNNTYYHITSRTIVMSTLITIHTSADNAKDMYDFASVK